MKKNNIILFILFIVLLSTFTYSINNTAIKQFEIVIPNFNISGSDYQLVSNNSIDIGDPKDLYFRGSLQSNKNSPSTSTNQLFIKLEINGEIKFDEKVANIIDGNDVKVSNRFLKIPSQSGDIDVAIYAREVGSGSVQVKNLEIHSLTNVTKNNYSVNIKDINEEVTIINQELTNIVNFSINNLNNSKTIIDLYDRVNSTGKTTIFCQLKNSNNDTLSSYIRHLYSDSDLGFTGAIALNNISITGTENISLYCYQDTLESVTHNLTGYIIDLKNSKGEEISHIQKSYKNERINNKTKVIEILNYNITEGEGIEVNSLSIFGNSTSQLVETETLYDGLTSPIFSRYIRDIDDYATVRYVSNHNQDNITNYSLMIEPLNNEYININSNLLLIEIMNLNVTEKKIPPLIEIKHPLNNSIQWYDNQDINISVTSLDDDFSPNGYCVVELISNYSGSSNTTIIDSNFTNNTKINYNDFDFGDYQLNITCTDNNNLSSVSSIYITLNCTEIWVEDPENCTNNYTRIKTYSDTNSCGTDFDLPDDNNTLLDCKCNYGLYNLLGYIVPYCNINTTCNVIADTTNSSLESDMNTTIVINDVEYNMTYNNGQWTSGITDNISSDNKIILTSKVINDGLLYCSNNITGILKFRKAFNISISFYKKSYLNDSYVPKLYKNDFNYVYLVLEDVYDTNSILGGIDNYAKSLNDAVRNLNEFLPFDNKMMHFDKVRPYTTAYVDNRIYHWSTYEDGISQIELFEKGNYSLNVIDTNMIVEPNLLNQYVRPFREDSIDIDSEVMNNLEINGTNNLHYKITANIIEIQGFALIPKIFWSVIILTIFIVVVIIASIIPIANKYLAPSVISVGGLIVLGVLKIIWGIKFFGLI